MHPTEEIQTGISFIPIGKNWGQQPSRMVIVSATPPKIASLHTEAAVSIVSARMGTFGLGACRGPGRRTLQCACATSGTVLRCRAGR